MANCNHCNDPVDAKTLTHWTDGDGTGYGHRGLCCDCFDLSCGMTLDELNKERVANGRPAATKPWVKRAG